MEIEKYISILERMIDEKLAWTDEMVGDKIVYSIWRQGGSVTNVLKEVVDNLKEHSFETLNHFKIVVQVI